MRNSIYTSIVWINPLTLLATLLLPALSLGQGEVTSYITVSYTHLTLPTKRIV